MLVARDVGSATKRFHSLRRQGEQTSELHLSALVLMVWLVGLRLRGGGGERVQLTRTAASEFSVADAHATNAAYDRAREPALLRTSNQCPVAAAAVVRTQG